MQSYGNPSVSYDWWAGNSGVARRSGLFIAAHAAHAGLIMFWAGAFTLFEIAHYDLSVPMGHQGLILIPHLASLGIGLSDAGAEINFEPYVAVAAFHLVSSAVLGAAGAWHILRAPKDLADAEGRAKKFDFKWDDPKQLTLILGHHLIFLGLGVIAFVEWAKRHGIYDTAIGAVRKVEPNIDLGMVWGYQTHFLSINSLEDVMGGHAVLSFILTIGGVWHIISSPFGPFKKILIYNGESILSYSLAGIALMGFVTSIWCAQNTTIYPVEFYGEGLKLNFGVSPYFSDTVALSAGQYTARAWLSNTHFYLAFFFLQGHFWHALRGMGFDFKNVTRALESMDTAKVN
ncbi:chlorophyll a/b binding light-harvesting protein [cyanobiont of Ornithocercus magnificus]|nr:chlorophyll a/b binding light-harvesting protein [cyanobiont of Ornithocercus magnificus]